MKVEPYGNWILVEVIENPKELSMNIAAKVISVGEIKDTPLVGRNILFSANQGHALSPLASEHRKLILSGSILCTYENQEKE